MMLLQQWIIVTVCLCLAGGQVLNGYINPLWMSDRRARARSLYNNPQTGLPLNSDYYMSRGGVYSDRPDLRRMSDLIYMDDLGRYHPVYSNDRVYRTEPRSYFTSAEQQQQEYVAVPPNSQTITHSTETES